MKIYIKLSLAFLILISANLFAQNNKQLYKTAFSYIREQNSESELVVVDNHAYLRLGQFSEDLSKLWKKGQLTTINLLDSIDAANEKKSHTAFLSGTKVSPV